MIKSNKAKTLVVFLVVALILVVPANAFAENEPEPENLSGSSSSTGSEDTSSSSSEPTSSSSTSTSTDSSTSSDSEDSSGSGSEGSSSSPDSKEQSSSESNSTEDTGNSESSTEETTDHESSSDNSDCDDISSSPDSEEQSSSESNSTEDTSNSESSTEETTDHESSSDNSDCDDISSSSDSEEQSSSESDFAEESSSSEQEDLASDQDTLTEINSSNEDGPSEESNGDSGEDSQEGSSSSTSDTEAPVNDHDEENAAPEPSETDIDEPDTSSDMDYQAECDQAVGDENDTVEAEEDEGNSYKAEITPGGIIDGEETGEDLEFTVTFTELSSTTKLGSVQMEIHDDFVADDQESGQLNISTFNNDGTPSSKTWFGSLIERILSLWSEDEASYLGQGESVSAVFSAFTPPDGERGVYEFDTRAWSDAKLDEDGKGIGTGTTANNMAAGYRNPEVIIGKGIGSVDDLEKIGVDDDYRVDDHYVQSGDIDFLDKYSDDHTDWNDGEGWQPIGQESPVFNGSYHGNGYTISNLHINRPDEPYIGLFGKVGDDARLYSVTLENVSIVGLHSIGSLVGLKGTRNGSESYVHNCFASGSVESTFYDPGTGGRSHVGGLIGSNHGPVTDSRSDCDVTGNIRVGGLIGCSHYGDIANSHSTGDVIGRSHAKADSPEASQFVKKIGGLIGNVDGGLITGCSATGDVTVIIGTEGIKVDKIGGLIGGIQEGVILSGNFAEGSVTVSSMDKISSVGGLIGYFHESELFDSFANSAVTVTGRNKIEDIGGLVGYLRSGTISGCYSTGPVLAGTLVKDVGEASYVGGLVGRSRQGTINNCYATGSVTGDDRVGGLVGYIGYGRDWDDDPDATISNSYSAGEVTAATIRVGGLVGTAHYNSEISSSYYDMETSGQTDTGKGEPKTTAEMYNVATFAGWDIARTTDFDPGDINVWYIFQDNHYPKLFWQYQVLEITADSLSKVYGEDDPALTCRVTAGSLAASDSLTGTPERDPGEDVGSYAIRQGSLSIDNIDNYLFSFVDGTLEITARPVTVTADSLSKFYGEDDPALTCRVTAGSLAAGDSLTGTPERDPGEDVGSYAIRQGSITIDNIDNYLFSFVDGVFEIKAPAVSEDPVDDPGDDQETPPAPVTPAPVITIPSGFPINLIGLFPAVGTVADLLVIAPETPRLEPVKYLVIPLLDPEEAAEPLITASFVRQAGSEESAAVLQIYEMLLQAFEENREELGEEEYAYALLDLAVALAAIRVVEAALTGEEAAVALAAEAYNEAILLLQEYGGFLEEFQLEALNDVLDAVAERLGALGANLEE